jgi:hypothetical protein
MEGGFSEVLTLPANRLPSPAQRAAIEDHIVGLNKLVEQTPERDGTAEKATTVIVTKLLLALPGQRTSEAGAEAKGEAYMAALDDVPCWAVAEAVRRWYRGDCDHILEPKEPRHNYSFVPAPAILRRLAMVEAYRLKARIADLQRVLDAVPYIDTSEHCRTMRGRIHALLPWMKMVGDVPDELPKPRESSV